MGGGALLGLPVPAAGQTLAPVATWYVKGHPPVAGEPDSYIDSSKRETAVLVRILGVPFPPSEMRARWLRLRVLVAIERTPDQYRRAHALLRLLLALCARAGDLGVVRWTVSPP